MKIVVSANGADLEAPASPMFGRCPVYVFVDTETMEYEAVQNPAIAAAGGAGIQAAQFVVERGAEAVVTGNVGPNAFNVFQSAGVPVYLFGGGTVRQAVEDCREGRLAAAGGASAPAHAGMGMGRGMGRRAAEPSVSPTPSREEEVATLKEMAGNLRKQLAEMIERLDRLEKGG
jgi:predicted Fe-Mo cluster-binding NifX family protein